MVTRLPSKVFIPAASAILLLGEEEGLRERELDVLVAFLKSLAGDTPEHYAGPGKD